MIVEVYSKWEMFIFSAWGWWVKPKNTDTSNNMMSENVGNSQTTETAVKWNSYNEWSVC